MATVSWFDNNCHFSTASWQYTWSGFLVCSQESLSDKFVLEAFKFCKSKVLTKHKATLAVYAMLTNALLPLFLLKAGKELILSERHHMDRGVKVDNLRPECAIKSKTYVSSPLTFHWLRAVCGHLTPVWSVVCLLMIFAGPLN